MSAVQLTLPSAAPLSAPMSAPVLAAGAWFNNAVCTLRGNEARLSAVVGDLATPDACIAHEAAMHSLIESAGPPMAIAHDLHPDFHSSRYAAELAQHFAVPAIPVQHHHAHIAAVCAEHGHIGPVIGLALDGVGLGTDNTPWGGELLRVDGASFTRLGHLVPLALPGGDRAAREPWRMAASVLHDLGRGETIVARYADEPAAAMVATMLAREINCPRTSSAGRLFDAAAGLLGLCHAMRTDAEAAIALERSATGYLDGNDWPATSTDDWRLTPEGALDLRPLLGRLVDAVATGMSIGEAAARFHATLVAALGFWAERACLDSGLGVVALGGGCFFNRLLAAGLRRHLEHCGLTVLSPIHLSPGDAGLALGQAWVAMHRLSH